MKYSFFRSPPLLGAFGAAAALMAVALAHDGDKSRQAAATGSPATEAPASAASAGVVVAKDPATGLLRPATAEEIAALQPAAGPKRAGEEPKLRSEKLPNGAVVTTLDRSYDVYSIASRDVDGKVHTACVPGYQEKAALDAAKDGTLTTKEALDEK